MKPIAILFLMTSCLNSIVVAEKQSAHAASSTFDASPAQISQQQRQQSHQQLQQQLSSRLQPTDEHIASSTTLNNDSHNQLIETNIPINTWYDSSTLSDNHNSEASANSESSRVNKGHSFQEDANLYNLKSYIADLLRIPIKSSWILLPPENSQHLFKNNYFSGLMPHRLSNSSNQQHEEHHLDKRDVADQLATEELPDYETEEENYPILLNRRFQVFRSNDPYSPSPYLSAQEFKETFRRSDPYVVGKRTRDLLSGLIVPFSTDKRAAPKFVGRRDSPYFVGKRETFDIPDDYLEDLALDENESPLSEDKRAAPRFIGRRGAPYFVGKRRAPKFIGKRNPTLSLQNDDLASWEDKRGAPMFVGKRRAPFFVGKREYPYNLPGSWSDLPSDRELEWLLEKKAAPKFVGRRGAPYFVGKRGPPMFIGKRVTGLEPGSDSFFEYGQGEVANLLGRRGSPYFVGKRRAPKFVGKRWAEPNLQEHASTKNKRRAPKFVGRRASPYFVGKRGPAQLEKDGLTEDRVEEETQTVSELKRAAPRFVGKRRAPYFVGKRGPPKFVGKRVINSHSSNPSMLELEEEQRPVKFIERRASPFFVGKKAAPKFVGKRLLDSANNHKDEQNLEFLNGNLGIETGSNKVSGNVGEQISSDGELVASNGLGVSLPQRLNDVDRLHAIGNLKARIQANTIQELKHLTESHY
ncbi:unnamed protein product [Candidula unifasciata]|uniref:Uncharacterized protein n=1 Tax=Candidula unifasciata TaxID=100452 RepID=A0A8S3ZP15_9EUPU|nr:unnamed protein product [Candidula unifasciata]